jgi:hypothetical protein
MSDIAPAYRDPLLHLDALRHVARPEGGRTEEAFAADSEKENAYTRTCAYTLSTRSSLLLEKACCPLPARSANWIDGPCFGALLYVFEGEVPCFTLPGIPPSDFLLAGFDRAPGLFVLGARCQGLRVRNMPSLRQVPHGYVLCALGQRAEVHLGSEVAAWITFRSSGSCRRD